MAQPGPAYPLASLYVGNWFGNWAGSSLKNNNNIISCMLRFRWPRTGHNGGSVVREILDGRPGVVDSRVSRSDNETVAGLRVRELSPAGGRGARARHDELWRVDGQADAHHVVAARPGFAQVGRGQCVH